MCREFHPAGMKDTRRKCFTHWPHAALCGTPHRTSFHFVSADQGLCLSITFHFSGISTRCFPNHLSFRTPLIPGPRINPWRQRHRGRTCHRHLCYPPPSRRSTPLRDETQEVGEAPTVPTPPLFSTASTQCPVCDGKRISSSPRLTTPSSSVRHPRPHTVMSPRGRSRCNYYNPSLDVWVPDRITRVCAGEIIHRRFGCDVACSVIFSANKFRIVADSP